MEILVHAGLAYGRADPSAFANGALIVGGILLLGAIKCIAISRRETTQSLCALSLAFLLGSISLSSLLVLLLSKLAPNPLNGLLSLPVVGLLFASPVLAILGLVSYRRQRVPYVQGKAQAIWTLVLFGGFVASGTWGVIRSAERAAQVATPHQKRHLHSRPHGVSLSFPHAGWVHHEDLAKMMPGVLVAEVHATTAAALIVSAFDVPPTAEHAADDELVTAAARLLSAQLGLSVLPEATRLPDAIGSTHEFTCERRVGGRRAVYQARFVRRSKLAFLVQAWWMREFPEGRSRMLEALGALGLEDRAQSPLPHEWPANSNARRALLSAELGEMAFAQGLLNKAADYFRHAVSVDPSDEGHLVAAFRCLADTGRHKDARRLFQEFIPYGKRSLDLRSWGPYFDLHCGFTEQALEEYTRLFADGHNSEEDLYLYLGALQEAGQFEIGIFVLKNFISRCASLRAERWLGKFQAWAGRHDEAVDTFQRLRSAHAGDPTIAAELVWALSTAERHAYALAAAEEAIGDGVASVDLHEWEAQSAVVLRRYGEAKVAVEAGLAIDPTREGLRALLLQLSSRLGEGANSSIKHPLEPVPIPARLRELAERSVTHITPGMDEYAMRYNARIVALSYRAGERLRKTTHLDYVIQDPKTAPAAGSVAYRFRPVRERVFVNRLDILGEDGSLVAQGDPSTYYVQQEDGSSRATDDHLLVLPVPGVRPGVRVIVEVTVEERFPADELHLVSACFAHEFPCALRGYSVEGDVHTLTHRESNGVAFEGSEDTLLWYAVDPIPLAAEPLQPHPAEFAPWAWMADASATWETVTQSYLERIADRLRVDPQTSALAEELVADELEPEARVELLARHVQDRLVYKSIGFGQRAQVPEPVPLTLERGWGDCKDHALLLHQLLTSVGIESHLALVQAGVPSPLPYPSIQPFNHMIVYVPSVGRFIDATDKSTDVMARVPVLLDDRPVLVLDPEQPRLLRTPAYSEGDNAVSVERVVRVFALGETKSAVRTRVTSTVRWRGYPAGYVRMALESNPVEQREALVRRWLPSADFLEIESCSLHGLDAPDEPLVLQVTYLEEGAFQTAGEAVLGRLPSPWEDPWLATEPCVARCAPFRLSAAATVASRTTVVPPPGYRFASPPPGNAAGDSSFDAWTCAWSREGLALRVTYRHQTTNGRHAPSRYAEFVRAREQATAPLRQTLRLVATPSVSAASGGSAQ